MSEVCQNCGYQHDGSFWKEFTDGDGLPIMIEVCKNFMTVWNFYYLLLKINLFIIVS